MSYRNRYEPGNWNVICDACGREYKANQLRKRWDGVMVCPQDWEPRQPQDFVRGVADKIVPEFTRPEQQDNFVVVACTMYTSQGVTGVGTTGCAKTGINYGLNPTNYP